MADTQFMGFRGGFVVCNGDENLLFNYTETSGSPMRLQRNANTIFELINGGSLNLAPYSYLSAAVPALKISSSADVANPFIQLYDAVGGEVATNIGAVHVGSLYTTKITTLVDPATASAAALQLVADTGSAAPVNKLFSFGYTDNLDAYQETMYATAVGKLYLKNDLLWSTSANIGSSGGSKPGTVYASTAINGAGSVLKENALDLGPQAATNKTITALQTGTVDQPFIKFVVGAPSKWQYSNDGTTALDFGSSTTTLDGAYNNFGGAGIVSVDAGDLTWSVASNSDFIIDDSSLAYFYTDVFNAEVGIGNASGVKVSIEGKVKANITFVGDLASHGIYTPAASTSNLVFSTATGSSGNILLATPSGSGIELRGDSLTISTGVPVTYWTVAPANSLLKQTGYFEVLAGGVAAWPGSASASGIATTGQKLEFINSSTDALLQGVSVKVDGTSGTTVIENTKTTLSMGTDGKITISPDTSTSEVLWINNPRAEYYGIWLDATGGNTNPAYQYGIYCEGQVNVFGTTATNLAGESWLGVRSVFSSTGTGLGAGEEIHCFYGQVASDVDDASDNFGFSALLSGAKGSGYYAAFQGNGAWTYALSSQGKITHTCSTITGWTGNHTILETIYTSGGNNTSNLYGHRIYIGNDAGDSSATYYGLHLDTSANTTFTKYGIWIDGDWKTGLESRAGLHVLSRTNGTWQGFGPILTVQNLNSSGDSSHSLYAYGNQSSNSAFPFAVENNSNSSTTQGTRYHIGFTAAKTNRRYIPLAEAQPNGGDYSYTGLTTFDTWETGTVSNNDYLTIPLHLPHSATIATVYLYQTSPGSASGTNLPYIGLYVKSNTTGAASLVSPGLSYAASTGAAGITLSPNRVIDNVTYSHFIRFRNLGTGSSGSSIVYYCYVDYEITDFGAGCGW